MASVHKTNLASQKKSYLFTRAFVNVIFDVCIASSKQMWETVSSSRVKNGEGYFINVRKTAPGKDPEKLQYFKFLKPLLKWMALNTDTELISLDTTAAADAALPYTAGFYRFQQLTGYQCESIPRL